MTHERERKGILTAQGDVQLALETSKGDDDRITPSRDGETHNKGKGTSRLPKETIVSTLLTKKVTRLIVKKPTVLLLETK